MNGVLMVPERIFSSMRRSARQLEPELACVSAALLIPDHAYVGVATLMSALDEALSRRGVVVTPASVQ
ncbi:MAG: hypothetical protein HY554_16210, partial [Elusimicrobia bacterium]|nr:hypothetical protein [Elusimicrobiota bacterium]